MKKDKLNKLLSIAQENLTKDGKLLPVAFLELEDNSEEIIGISDMPEEHINRAFMLFRLGARAFLDFKKKVNKISFLSEVWYSKQDAKKKGKKIIQPRLDPNRKEAIMIIEADNKGKTDIAIKPFTKEKGKIVFINDPNIEKSKGEKKPEMKDNLLMWFWRGYKNGKKIKKEVEEKMEKIEKKLVGI